MLETHDTYTRASLVLIFCKRCTHTHVHTHTYTHTPRYEGTRNRGSGEMPIANGPLGLETHRHNCLRSTLTETAPSEASDPITGSPSTVAPPCGHPHGYLSATLTHLTGLSPTLSPNPTALTEHVQSSHPAYFPGHQPCSD